MNQYISICTTLITHPTKVCTIPNELLQTLSAKEWYGRSIREYFVLVDPGKGKKKRKGMIE